MATPKTITAYDVTQGDLIISRVESDLVYQRTYWLVDDVGNPLEDTTTRKISGRVALSSIPPDVLAALQTIDNWTYNLELAQEGME